MKKIFVVFLLFFQLVAKAQRDISKIKFIEPPDSTAIGTADGKLITKEISPAGGTIDSEDGRVQLIFPAGALAINTTISIQPITNLAPNGAGKAYLFEPSGIQFKKPVQLIFHYTEEEEEICPADLMGFGMQDDKGKWSFFDYDAWDSVSKTLKGSIEHFSSLTNLNKMKLSPAYQKLRVSDTLLLHIIDISKKFKKRPAFLNIALTPSSRVPLWYVNDVLNGNEIYGQTTPFALTPNPQVQSIHAEYRAPKLLTDKSPVKVKVKLFLDKIEGSKETLTLLKGFVCKIDLYDEYKILITDTVAARVGEGYFVADSGSFIATVTSKNISVTDAKNYTPYLIIKHKPPLCKTYVFVERPCTGTVHIGRSDESGEGFAFSNSRFVETNKPVKVLIKFDVHENLAFRFQQRCPGGVSTPVENMKLQSVPNLVYFLVNGETQKYPISNNRDTPYTIYVTRIGQGKYIVPE